MKKTLIASVLAAAGAAQAQAPATNVQLYGLIDVAVERLNHVAPTGGSLTRMPNITGTLPSRWGLRGSEDLGDGLRAVFTLESGFSPDTGGLNQGGRLFGRQAYVGLASNSWGQLTFGRQYSFYYLSMLDAGIFGPNIYGVGSLDPYIPQARFDNAIAWQGRWGAFSAGANYSLGRDVAAAPAGAACGGESATDAQACRAASAMLKYDTAAWGAAFAWDRQRGGAGAAAGLGASDLSDERLFLTAYAKLGAWKVGAGWIRRDNESTTAVGRRSNLGYVEAAYAITPALSLEAQIAKLDYRGQPEQATLLSLRGTYALSKRTAAYVTAGRIDNDGRLNLSASGGSPGGNPAAGGSQTGLAVGMRHAF
ncbi:porin [Azohydromonas caseinilytica]|uniref:Porin n=1 Tax=Azohydromonas caseinilytica TaxID=2728836 RepID=A0A848FAR3_9BURK|nr:porin [Azohydromonas caseinilytica]NML16378.1 porin [Azohydromonas caseinilytica]